MLAEEQKTGIRKLTELWRREVAWELEDLAQAIYNNVKYFESDTYDQAINRVVNEIMNDGDLLTNLAVLVYERYELLHALHD